MGNNLNQDQRFQVFELINEFQDLFPDNSMKCTLHSLPLAQHSHEFMHVSPSTCALSNRLICAGVSSKDMITSNTTFWKTEGCAFLESNSIFQSIHTASVHNKDENVKSIPLHVNPRGLRVDQLTTLTKLE